MDDRIAHIWLVRLKEGRAISEALFASNESENVRNAALEANGHGEHHALFVCDDEPDLLAAIGYVSTDPESSEGQKARATRFLEFVTHQDLFIFSVEVCQVALGSDKITLLFSESEPADSDSLPGKGAWAVSMAPLPVAGRQNQHTSEPPRKTWVQVVASEDAGRLKQAGPAKRFNKFLETRTTSQLAK
ncbi:hypothetical protein F4678DRAFT_122899 [Xylaria arbuscula]|nr:hypothetical protein F4678DRAFT_122899 [Xylaria arbuscula]